MKKFICKQGASNFYLVNSGMGGFLNPPTHPEHNYSIQEFRGGHEVGSYSLTAAANESYLPARVRGTAKGALKRWQTGEIDPVWLASVYNYFRHCYSKDGVNRNASDCITFGKFWDNADLEPAMNPEHHLGYMFVKQFYPDHTPDIELIKNDPGIGSWSKGK